MIFGSPFGTATFAGATAVASAAPPPPPDLREALYAYLVADAGLAAIVADRIYYDAVPESARWPNIRLEVVSNVRGHHLRGSTGGAVARVRVECRSRRKADCLALKLRLEAILDGLIGPMAGLPVDWAGQLDDRDSAEFPADGSDAQLRAVAVDYRIKYRCPAYSNVLV